MLNIDKIKKQVGFHIPATEGQIRICNIKLKQNNLPEIPNDYANLLQICNGFSNEDCCVFGAEIPRHNWYKDIVTFNVSYFHKQASNWLILGENDYFYFVYGAEPKMYALVDRDTLDIENSDKDFSSILEEILRIE